VFAVLVLLAVVWRFTPLAEYLQPRKLFLLMRDFARHNDFALPVFSFLIGLANVFLVPINLLLMAVAMVYPGWKGFACGLCGAWIAAILEHSLGRSLGAKTAERTFGDRFKAISHEMRDHGLPALIALGLVPVAPNTFVNLAAGICRVPLWKLLIATTIGFLPGLIVLNFLGREVRQLFQDPSLGAVLSVLGFVVILFLLPLFTKRIKAAIRAQKDEGTNKIARTQKTEAGDQGKDPFADPFHDPFSSSAFTSAGQAPALEGNR
jgi:uncharacterized membrane protein YdjX (TVP38/TMEM64 family)